MTRAELEHIIRAAASIADDDEIVIIGSQSILGTYPNAPEELRVSREADIFPLNRPERWDLLDGSLGERSAFHEAFGYYAQGVGEDTAVLPRGWKTRLVPIRNANTRGATGLTLDVHDLAISKYAANREKDRAFLQVAVKHKLLQRDVVMARLAMTPQLTPDQVTRITAQVAADFSAAT